MTDRPKNDPRTPPETGPVRTPATPASTHAPVFPSAPSSSTATGISTPSGPSLPPGAASVTRPSPAPAPAQGKPVPERGPRLWPRVAGVLVLLLGAGGVWVWQNPEPVRHLLNPGGNAEREAAEARVKALEARLARLEQRPVADLVPLATRMDVLEKRPAPVIPPAVDVKPLVTRLEAVEARAALPLVASTLTDLRPYTARIEALEQKMEKPAIDPARIEALEKAAARPAIDPARIEALEKQAARPVADPAKLDELAARIEAVAARDPAGDLRTRLAETEKHLTETEKQVTGLAATATTVTQVSDRLSRLARVRAAAVALTAGQKLGEIPDAPPALARFATVAPPTETGLRLAFPAAERAALEVSLPDMKGKPLLDRMLARLQDYHLITVRQGDDVVIGNLTAETLTHARMLLNAGDLAGAVKAVSTLTGAPAQAMAGWVADAKALLAAREALAALAGNG